jgi:hypothetical protein
MTSYQILYWHDIPVQVRAGVRRDRVSVELSQRFLTAVDNAAMAANVTGTDNYLAGFEWGETEERDGPAAEVAAAVASELESRYEKIDWRATAATIRGDSDSS